MAGPTTIGDGGKDYRDKLILDLLGTGEKLLAQGFQNATEEAYLEGQAKAAQLETEAQLEGNPLTSAWSTAGYRDMTARLKLADAEADFMKQLPTLREQGPDKLNEYLTKRRASLVPMFEGMSQKAREAAVAQVVLSDQAATSKHAVEHVKWRREQQLKALQAQATPLLEAMSSAQKLEGQAGVDAMNSAVKNYTGFLGSVLVAPDLTAEDKDDLIGSAVEMALAQDNLALMQYLHGKLPNVESDSAALSIMGSLGVKTQESIAKAEYSAQNRTEARRTEHLRQTTQSFRFAFRDGSYTGGFDAMRAHAQYMIQHGGWTAQQANSFEDEYFAGEERKRNESAGNLEAYLQGKSAEMGKTEDQMYTAAVNKFAKEGWPPEQQIKFMLQTGLNGHATGFKHVGYIAERAMTGLNTLDGKTKERERDLVGIMEAFDSLPGGEHGANAQAILSGMNDTSKERFMYLRRMLRESKPIEQAWADRLELEKQYSQMSPQMRAATAKAKLDEAQKIVRERAKGGSGFKDYLFGWASDTAEFRETLLPDASLGIKQLPAKVHADQIGKAQNAWLAEVADYYVANPFADPEEAVTAAGANVAARTLKIGDGRLVLSTAPQKLLGVQYSNEEIARALSDLKKPSVDDGRIVVYGQTGNQIAWYEVTPDGEYSTAKGVVTKQDIEDKLRKQQIAQLSISRNVLGEGAVYVDPKFKARVQYNGRTTAPVDPYIAFELRTNLVRNEGVRDTEYDDGYGNITSGVGVHYKAFRPKPGTDGKIAQADINGSFRRASDEALTHAEKLRQQFAGINPVFQNPRSTVLLAELAYQEGPLVGEKVNPAYSYMLRARTASDALTAFRQTGVYEKSGATRKAHYERMINEFWKGK